MIVLPASVLEKCDEKTKKIILSVLNRVGAQLIDAHQFQQIKFDIKIDIKKDEEIKRKMKK